jgi:hypothetical protein
VNTEKEEEKVFLHFLLAMQGIIRGKNCSLSTDTPNYQLGWPFLAASSLLDTLKRNFHFL